MNLTAEEYEAERGLALAPGHTASQCADCILVLPSLGPLPRGYASGEALGRV